MKKYKLFIIIFLIAIVPIAFVATSSKISKYHNEKKYLSNNNREINLDNIDDFSGLELLKDDIKDKKIIFTGEDHTLDKDNLFKIKMVKYLKKEINLNYCLEESGLSNTYFINKYLETGEESVLRKAFNNAKGTATYNVDDYNFYKQLYQFNQSLPKEEMIKVVGIDIEHNTMNTYEFINDIIKNKEYNNEKLNKLLSSLKKTDPQDVEYISLRTINNEIIEDLKINKEEYISIFKENIDMFEYITNNIEAMCVSYISLISNNDYNKWNNIRDKYMYENFKLVDSKLKDAKYFGQWGSYHIFQDTMYMEDYPYEGENNSGIQKIEFIASLLNKDKDYKGKILSIQYGYYSPKLKENINSSIDINIFKEYLEKESGDVLFKLDSKGSPFIKELTYPLVYKFYPQDKEVTTDYFQYLLLIKDSDKSKILK